ncbi:MAG TPA: GTPase, partial [Arthrobacter sp.]|nr:GTPase [Arthrobacter sp.]
MHITLVSSLDALCRAPALDHLSSGRANTAVVIHDLLENGTVVRQVFHDGRLLERHENLLEHGCLSCTVRLDVAPTVERLLADGYEHIIMGLPPTMAASMAVHGITQGVKSPFTIGAVVLACDPSSLEDQMWDRHTLFGSGYTAARKEERTAGEFLLEELSFSDTVFLAGPFPSSAGNHRGRGLLLLRELAPHSTLLEAGSTRSPARHDAAEAKARSVPGTVRIPAADTSTLFTTALHRVQRPL